MSTLKFKKLINKTKNFYEKNIEKKMFGCNRNKVLWTWEKDMTRETGGENTVILEVGVLAAFIHIKLVVKKKINFLKILLYYTILGIWGPK